MSIFLTSKSLSRMNKMIENAMNGRSTESVFDESKMSAVESRLNQYLKMTEAKNKALEDERDKIRALISDISHQTKTPLSNILLYSSLLKETSSLPPEGQNIVNQIAEQSEKLSFLIAALIKSSRLETGIITVKPARNSIAELMENVLPQLSARSEAKSIVITQDVGEEAALFDMKWTAEAIYNIVDNAVKYTPEGGGVNITCTEYSMFMRIAVADTGMGISEEELPKIFGRFYRSPRCAQAEGVGIGLFLAREIISAQGGYIRAASKIGGGSVFSVFLPK